MSEQEVELFGGPGDGKKIKVSETCSRVRIPVSQPPGFSYAVYDREPPGRFDYVKSE